MFWYFYVICSSSTCCGVTNCMQNFCDQNCFKIGKIEFSSFGCNYSLSHMNCWLTFRTRSQITLTLNAGWWSGGCVLFAPHFPPLPSCLCLVCFFLKMHVLDLTSIPCVALHYKCISKFVTFLQVHFTACRKFVTTNTKAAAFGPLDGAEYFTPLLNCLDLELIKIAQSIKIQIFSSPNHCVVWKRSSYVR